MEIGKFLKQARKEKNITQLESSKRVGISRSYFSDLEGDRYFPSGELLFKLNEEFDLFYLIENDGKTIHYMERR